MHTYLTFHTFPDQKLMSTILAIKIYIRILYIFKSIGNRGSAEITRIIQIENAIRAEV